MKKIKDQLKDKLVIAISSRALFDLEESNRVYDRGSLEEYVRYSLSHENKALKPGVAFSFIKRLLELRYPDSGAYAVEVILVSRNDANTGLRVFNSIGAHGLNITRAAFTKGTSPYKYIDAFRAHLFLSAKPSDVQDALEHGKAAATILPGSDYGDSAVDQVRIAFDGDAVLFSGESEKIYKDKGMDAFMKHETQKSNVPMGPGPFKPFLKALNKVQEAFLKAGQRPPIRTALVTSRSAPAHKRLIKTLRGWGVSVDESFFLGGLDKAPILEKFRPHIFFDDQKRYCDTASKVVPTGHVPSAEK